MGLLDLFKKKGSSDVAKDRLKLLLVSDRANCSPEVMEMIKNDILKSFLNIWRLIQTDLIFRLHLPSLIPIMVLYQRFLLIFQLRI